MDKFFSNIVVAIFFAVLIFASTVYAGNGKKTLKPKNHFETVKLKILGRTYVYYALEDKCPVVLSLRGPAKIKIYGRAACKKGEEKTTFEIRCAIDGKEPFVKSFKNIPVSRKAKFVGMKNFAPSENRNVIINVPEGYHTIEIYGKNLNGEKLYAKFHLFKKKGKKKRKWISLAPLSPNEPVNLIANEELVEYYRFSAQRPLKVSVIGPTKLRMLTRVETREPTKKNVSYRIAVSEKGKLLNSFLLWTSRSFSAKYEKDADYIPAKAREIIIDVPKGLHVYEIHTPDKDTTILARFFIPYKDVNIGLAK